jgi:hypothetical protein
LCGSYASIKASEEEVTDLTIRLDRDAVQSTVQAAIRPAVERALEGVDLEKVIANALVSPSSPSGFAIGIGPDGQVQYPHRRNVLEQLIHDGVEDIAQQHVAKLLLDQEPAIEDALSQALQKSHDRIVGRFTRAMLGAIKQDWKFELDVRVTAAETEEEFGDDD